MNNKQQFEVWLENEPEYYGNALGVCKFLLRFEMPELYSVVSKDKTINEWGDAFLEKYLKEVITEKE